ncbi:MAG: hypothetical protein LBV45_01385 [Xanthomonadaceae bacterium]|jgi:hypothetical protein|nr:hypothetical protein [Xanthomonadaceae bacterium]
MLAFGMATGVHAQQSKPSNNAGSTLNHATALPVLDKGSGKVEAVLLLEPAHSAAAGTRWRFRGAASLDTAFQLSAGDSVGLLCNGASGVNLSNLASNHCLLASFSDSSNDHRSKRIAATASLNHSIGRVGLTAGNSQSTLPSWLSFDGSRTGNGQVEQNDLAIFGQKDIGSESYVSIAGTYAKARLVPLSEAAPGIIDRWESKSLSIGGGYGSFSANVIGRVVDVPGQSGKWEGVGVGLTWRTPWSGQLTVGAENVITRGKNPFAPTYSGSQQEGTVPYVRYEQDL